MKHFNSSIVGKRLSLSLSWLFFIRTVFRFDCKWYIINFVELSFVWFANIFKRSLIVDLKIISIEFNTKELFIDFIDCFNEFFNIIVSLVSFIKVFIISFIKRTLSFEEFTIGKIIFFLLVIEFTLMFGLSSITWEEIFILEG